MITLAQEQMLKNAEAEIRASYAPYSDLTSFPEFEEGFLAYVNWKLGAGLDPYEDREDMAGQIASQAWARGANAAMRVQQAAREITAGEPWKAPEPAPLRRPQVRAEPAAEAALQAIAEALNVA
jgi:hypothetical protein